MHPAFHLRRVMNFCHDLQPTPGCAASNAAVSRCTLAHLRQILYLIMVKSVRKQPTN